MTLSEEEFADRDDSPLLKHIKAQRWQHAMDMLEHNQNMASVTDKYGNTPLHAALGYKAPDSLILLLLQAYPDATRMHGTDDWLPLHVAAMWGSSAVVMNEMIRKHPEALDDPGEGGVKGRTPRHFSTRFEHNQALLQRSTKDWMAMVEEESTVKGEK